MSQYQTMPALQISREAIKTLKRYHTNDEIANALFAVVNYIWDDVEPDELTVNEINAFETIMEYTKPKADEWLNTHNKRVQSAIDTNNKKKAKKAAKIEPNTNFENEPVNDTPIIDFKPIYEPLQPVIEQDSIPVPEGSYNGLTEAEIEIIESRADSFVTLYNYYNGKTKLKGTEGKEKINVYCEQLKNAGINPNKWSVALRYTGELIKQKELNTIPVDEDGRTWNEVG